MKRELTCIVCPRGCSITVELDGKEIRSVEGYTCKRGLEYAKNECTHPQRTLTTTVKTASGGVVAVRTDKPVPKEKMFECMNVINTITASEPIKIGDILLSDILGTGANVVASQNKQ